jgi:hypothetical protein
MRISFITAVVAAVAAICVGQAQASTNLLGNPSAQTEVFNFPNGTLIENLQTAPQSSALGSNMASVKVLPNPSLLVIATGNDFSNYAELNYNFEITGPAENIPIIVHGALNTQAIGSPVTDAFAVAVFALGQGVDVGTAPGDGLFLAQSCASNFLSCQGYCPTSASCGDGSFNEPLTLVTNTEYAISIDALSETDGGGTARAIVDPYITFGTPLSDPGLYSFNFSNGIGNAPGGIPEPATWAMLLLGLFSLGTALRRSRRTAFA